MVEDALVENLIMIQISRSSSNPSSQDRKLLVVTDFSIENRIENLVVSDSKVRSFGVAEDDGILGGFHHFPGKSVVDPLGQPGFQRTRTDQPDGRIRQRRMLRFW